MHFALNAVIVAGSVFYRKDEENVITINKLYYPVMGPDAFFWAGSDSPGCNDDSVGDTSYALTPGKVGSKILLLSQQNMKSIISQLGAVPGTIRGTKQSSPPMMALRRM